MKRHCELLPARNYYGPHATGSVVLVNGHPEFHGKTKDAKAFYKRVNKAVDGLKDLADTLMSSASKHFGIPKGSVVVTIKKRRTK
jgi:methenyltetrahydromethanopterin cyclohydrolase